MSLQSLGPQAKRDNVGDLFLHTSPDIYGQVSAPITSIPTTGTPGAVTDVVGYPLKLVGGKYVMVQAGDEANVTAMAADTKALEALAADADSAGVYRIVDRGEVTLNRDKMRATDSEGAAYNIANLVAALEALGWRVIDESSKKSTQTESTQ